MNIDKAIEYIEWEKYNKFSEYDWWMFSASFAKNLPEDFLEHFFKKLDWVNIIQLNKLSDEFIERHLKDFRKDSLGWWEITKYQKLSEKFLERHFSDICKSDAAFGCLKFICEKSKPSIEFKRKYQKLFKKKLSKTLYKEYIEDVI